MQHPPNCGMCPKVYTIYSLFTFNRTPCVHAKMTLLFNNYVI